MADPLHRVRKNFDASKFLIIYQINIFLLYHSYSSKVLIIPILKMFILRITSPNLQLIDKVIYLIYNN